MPTFKSAKGLENYIKGRLQKAVKESQDGATVLMAADVREFYGEYQPIEYIRMGQLMNSINTSGVEPSGNGYRAEVWFDPSLMKYESAPIGQSGEWHYANWSPDTVLDVAMTGGTDGLPHGGKVGGTPIWKNVSADMKSEMPSKIKIALINAGIPVK